MPAPRIELTAEVETPAGEPPPARSAPKPRTMDRSDHSNRPSYLRPVEDEDAFAQGSLAPKLRPQEVGQPDGVTKPLGVTVAGRFLTDVIVDLGYTDRQTVDAAVQAAREIALTPEQLLLEQHAIAPDQLARAVAERHGLDHLDLSQFKVDMAAANLVNSSSARRYEAVPVAFVDERTLLVAMADPANILAVDDIAIMTGLEVRPAVASRDDIEGLVTRLNRLDEAVRQADEDDEELTPGEVVDLQETADDAPVIKLVHSFIAQAVEVGASDIHFEPEGNEMRVRFRVDGVMAASAMIPRRMVAGVVSRVKIMAELDISERRIPQDGRMGLLIEGRHVDVRVVTLPSVNGESVVLRILDQGAVKHDLEGLGMLEHDAARFRKAFGQAYGAVLTTGPTGSGKSTTLYAALQELNVVEKNIITIEDPVEFKIDGLTQVQINPKTGFTFATGLRSMMRADPDILMVGEIRDRETAQIAVEAALTGHLVLSTLHTNDAPTAITRLIEMGIEPFLVASSVGCVVAQRLARCLCPSCKKRLILPVGTLKDHGFHATLDVEAYDAAGCGRCNWTGYKGRLGLYEVMTVTDDVRELVLGRRPADEISAVAVKQGMRQLRDDGLEKVKLGRTSIAEVVRVTGSG